jgi:hypothetical protein
MMLWVAALPNYKQDANGQKSQKKGQRLCFGCHDKFLWLETATSSLRVSLYFEEIIQHSST